MDYTSSWRVGADGDCESVLACPEHIPTPEHFPFCSGDLIGHHDPSYGRVVGV